MPEVYAWGNYDEVAKSARRLDAPELRRRDMNKARQNQSVGLLEEGQSPESKKNWSAYFQSVSSFEGLLTSSPPVAPTGEEEDEKKPTVLSFSVSRNIRKIFSVYFEGSYVSTKQSIVKKKQFSIKAAALSLLTSFDATMPWVQPYIESNFMQFCKDFVLFLELSLRGISQVYFQNNPLSGLLILIGLFLQSSRVAVYGVIALVFGNITSFGLRFDSGLARSGLFGYNAILVGLALATFDSPSKHADYSVGTAIFTIIISCVSSILLVTIGKVLHPYKSPPLTLPFNIATMMFLLAVANIHRLEYGPVVAPALPEYRAQDIVSLSGVVPFFAGTIRGIGQVFLADNVVTGWLVLAGIGVSSRIAAIAAFLGAALGNGVALAMGVDADVVSAGLFGYNASLSVTALVTFYTPNEGAAFLAVMAGVVTVIAQMALASLLQPFGLPVMTLPFCVVTLPFIIMQGTTSLVIAVPLPQLTVPEDHMHRVKTLEDGIHFLKETLHPEEERNYGWKMRRSIRQLHHAISIGASNDEDQNQGGKKDKNDWVRMAALEIFTCICSSNATLRLDTFRQALSRAGLRDDAGLGFASIVFQLMDLDHSKSIEKNEFVALCLVSQAVSSIRTKISKFVDFVDLNSNGWIDFEEIDSALDYLGQGKLTNAERESLSQMTGANEEEEIEVVELINLLTARKIESMVAHYHNNTEKP